MSQEKRRELEAMIRLVEDRYGPRLTEDELVEVRKAVEANVDAAYQLRAVKLTNADEPFQIFKPLRASRR